jgi:hypothetical protein
MECVLCHKTSTEVAIDPLLLRPEIRTILQKQLGINPDKAFAKEAICRECLALPFGERNKLAEKAIRSAQDKRRRDQIRDELNHRQN